MNRVSYAPFHKNDCESLIYEPMDHVKLFCIGFKLQDYLNSLSPTENDVFMEDVYTLFDRYQSISPQYNIDPKEGLRIIENIKQGALTSASYFAHKISPHGYLREAFLQFEKQI